MSKKPFGVPTEAVEPQTIEQFELALHNAILDENHCRSERHIVDNSVSQCREKLATWPLDNTLAERMDELLALQRQSVNEENEALAKKCKAEHNLAAAKSKAESP